MMSEVKHTPIPWSKCGASDGKCQCGMIWSQEADMPVVAILSTCRRHETYNAGEGIEPSAEEFHANVDLVVRAVNSHDALLAACKSAQRIEYLVDRLSEISGQGTADEERTLAELKAIHDGIDSAIRQAEEGAA